jgi:hypothetical protein
MSFSFDDPILNVFFIWHLGGAAMNALLFTLKFSGFQQLLDNLLF